MTNGRNPAPPPTLVSDRRYRTIPCPVVIVVHSASFLHQHLPHGLGGTFGLRSAKLQTKRATSTRFHGHVDIHTQKLELNIGFHPCTYRYARVTRLSTGIRVPCAVHGCDAPGLRKQVPLTRRFVTHTLFLTKPQGWSPSIVIPFPSSRGF